MGRNGKEYIKRNYRWDVIMAKYDRLLAAGSIKRSHPPGHGCEGLRD